MALELLPNIVSAWQDSFTIAPPHHRDPRDEIWGAYRETNLRKVLNEPELAKLAAKFMCQTSLAAVASMPCLRPRPSV